MPRLARSILHLSNNATVRIICGTPMDLEQRIASVGVQELGLQCLRDGSQEEAPGLAFSGIRAQHEGDTSDAIISFSVEPGPPTRRARIRHG